MAKDTQDKMEQFFTQDRASEGIKLPLTGPSGERTEEYITIRSVLSDEFRTVETAQKRRMIRDIPMLASDADKAVLHREYERELVASLVKDWSFDQPCTKGNVIEFLKKAPKIQDQIDKLASNDQLFFALPSTSS